MTEIILPLVFAYLIGSIPTAVWVGKWFYKVDVREHGSGNAGATNTIRVLGLKAGIPVLLIDVIKGYVAVLMAPVLFELGGGEIMSPYLAILTAALAVVGHTIPVFAGFRGGKGVATLLGVGLGLFPVAAWVAVLIFAVMLIATKYVSLSSITAGVTFPFLCFSCFRLQTGLIMCWLLPWQSFYLIRTEKISKD